MREGEDADRAALRKELGHAQQSLRESEARLADSQAAHTASTEQVREQQAACEQLKSELAAARKIALQNESDALVRFEEMHAMLESSEAARKSADGESGQHAEVIMHLEVELGRLAEDLRRLSKTMFGCEGARSLELVAEVSLLRFLTELLLRCYCWLRVDVAASIGVRGFESFLCLLSIGLSLLESIL